MESLTKSRKNLTTLIVLIVLATAIPVILYLVEHTQVFSPKASGEPILFTGPNVITRNGAQKIKLDDLGKATVGLQLTSPFGPSVSVVTSTGSANP